MALEKNTNVYNASYHVKASYQPFVNRVGKLHDYFLITLTLKVTIAAGGVGHAMLVHMGVHIVSDC